MDGVTSKRGLYSLGKILAKSNSVNIITFNYLTFRSDWLPISPYSHPRINVKVMRIKETITNLGG